MADTKDTIEQIGHFVAGDDGHGKSRKERIDETRKPSDTIWWDGERGTSNCYIDDEEVKEVLNLYGVDCIHYDRSGEPDFSVVEQVHVKVSDMGTRTDTQAAARKKVLKTDWAKQNNINTDDELKKYMKENHYTLHECSDGITVRLIPRVINQEFKHAGGIAEVQAINEPLDIQEDGLLRTGSRVTAKTKLRVRQTGVKAEETMSGVAETVSVTVNEITDNTEAFIAKFVDVETLKELNQAGLDSASVAAVYAGTMSIVRNIIKVAKGEEEAKEAVMQVVTDTGGAAITAYATGALSQALTNQFGNVIPGDATMLIATGTFQLSKQVLAYASGELSEEQFKQNVAETAAYMTVSYIGRAAGTAVGAYIPVVGPIVGPIVGEMIATAVCEQVISAVRFSKEYEKKNAAIISACHNAEQEILDSQERLKALIEHENVEFRAAIEKGCSMISEGILGNSCGQVEDGLAVIGEQFGLEHAAFEYERTNRQNLFKRRVIVME